MWYRYGFLAVAFMASTAGAQREDPFAASVRDILGRRSDSPARMVERDAVDRLYGSPVPRPLWTVQGRGPTAQALDVIDVLGTAETRGLPSGYGDVETLRALADAAHESPANAARFDVALSRAVVRLLADLRHGRLDPATVRAALPNDDDDPTDLAALTTEAATANDAAAVIAKAEPAYAGYRALERALHRYRALAADSSLQPPKRTLASIRPGAKYGDLASLVRLLVALGDLAPSRVDSNPVRHDSTGTPLYAGAVVDAVASFQRRHGLDPDGVIGQATMSQLRVSLAHRVRQIELTLERWRWLPRHPPSRYVVVNIPSFRLYAFENDSAAQHPAVAMNVIVGKADGKHHTPVFAATMREVVFRPYWDVPARIARAELIPIFRRTPTWFDKEGYEIVRLGAGELGAATFPPTPQNFARVAGGDLRLRQRPGDANALGYIKFVFPNRYNVFLHDTPGRDLFSRVQRDFSHGCIRIAQPGDLAEFVLRGQTPWDRAAIDSMMQGDRTLHVPLARPVSVFVLYATVAVASDGTVSFYPDLYKQDAILERALGLAPVARR